MNYKKVFPSNYVRAVDIGEGKTLDVKVERVTIEKFNNPRGEEERKPVVHFVGTKRGLVLNKTNATSIANIAGDDDMDRWPDTVVRLYTVHVEAFGEKTLAIRIEEPPKDARPVEIANEEVDTEPPF